MHTQTVIFGRNGRHDQVSGRAQLRAEHRAARAARADSAAWSLAMLPAPEPDLAEQIRKQARREKLQLRQAFAAAVRGPKPGRNLLNADIRAVTTRTRMQLKQLHESRKAGAR